MTNQDQYFKSKEFKELLDKYTSAKEQGESLYLEPDEWADIAEYQYRLGNIDVARQTLDKAINTFAGAVLPLCYRAKIAIHTDNNPEEAERFLDQIDDKQDIEYIYTMAEVMVYQGKNDEADTFLEDNYSTIEDEEDQSFYFIDVATIFADYNNLEKAHKWLDRCKDKESVEYKEVKARLSLYDGKLDETEEIYNGLIDINPYSIDYWNKLSEVQLMRNNVDEAIQSSEFALAIDPDDDEALINKANGLISLGNYEGALGYYHKYNANHHENSSTILLESICQAYMGHIEQSVELLTVAESMQDVDKNIYYDAYRELAFAYSKIHKVEDALTCVDRMAEILDTSPIDKAIFKGHLLLENEQIDNAIVFFSKAIDLSGGDSHTIFTIGVSIYDNGYIQKAYSIFKALEDSLGDNMKEGWAYLAMCSKYLKLYDDYEQYAEKAWERNPNEAEMVIGNSQSI